MEGVAFGQDVFPVRTGLEIMRAPVTGEIPYPPSSHLLGV
jgi:hypothetical protein